MTDLNIKFTFSESAHVDTDRTFTSLTEATEHLLTALVFAPEGGCYDKTGFVLEFAGVVYEGRLDLQHMDVSTAHIGMHVLEHCQWVKSGAGRSFYERVGKAAEWKTRAQAADFWIRAIATVNAAETGVSVEADDDGQQGWVF